MRLIVWLAMFVATPGLLDASGPRKQNEPKLPEIALLEVYTCSGVDMTTGKKYTVKFSIKPEGGGYELEWGDQPLKTQVGRGIRKGNILAVSFQHFNGKFYDGKPHYVGDGVGVYIIHSGMLLGEWYGGEKTYSEICVKPGGSSA